MITAVTVRSARSGCVVTYLTRQTAMTMLMMIHVRPIHEPMIAPSSWSDNTARSSVDLSTYHTHTYEGRPINKLQIGIILLIFEI